MTRSTLQPSAGACLVAGTLIMTIAVLGTLAAPLRPVAAALILVCVALSVRALRPVGLPEGQQQWTPMVLLTGAAGLGLVTVAFNGLNRLTIPLLFLLLWCAAGTGGAFASPLFTRGCSLALPIVVGALLVRAVSSHPLDTDVSIFLTEGARALLHGSNPYVITYPNLYGPVGAELFYGEGVVQNGRIVYGFPYPPLVLLLSVPGFLLGDARFSGVAIICVVTTVLIAMSRTRNERVAAALLLCAPGLGIVVTPGWVEPIMVALLGLLVALVHRKNFALAAVVLGLLFVSKQYFIVLVPCLWLLRSYATPRRIALLVGSAAGTMLPALLWDPHAFWRAVVEWQFIQPFRPDSISLYVAAVQGFSWPTDTPAGSLGLVAGFLAAGVLAYFLRAGPTSFAFSIGIALTITVLLSKQAFLNYYYLCGSALLIAAWSVAHDDSAPSPEPVAHHPATASVQAASHQGKVCRPLGPRAVRGR